MNGTPRAKPTLEVLLQFLYLTPVGVVKFGADGSIDLINPTASQMLLPLQSKSSLTNIFEALTPLIPTLQRSVDAFTTVSGTILDQQRLESQAGGDLMVLSLTVNRIDEAIYMAVLVDVTKVTEQERKLYADHQRFRAIFASVRDYAIFTVALDGVIDDWNRSLQRLGGWQADDVEGHHVKIFFPRGDASFADPTRLLEDARRIGSVETEGWSLKQDGSRIWCNTVITAMPDEAGSARGFVFVVRDMTERKRMEDELERLSIIDPLTGAFNRRYGTMRLEVELERWGRTGRPCSMLMLDIDHFKQVNDRFGHAAGDAVLSALFKACKSVLRAIDIVARWGGDEFVIVLPETGGPAAVVTAERVREAIGAVRASDGTNHDLAFTVSIGVAEVTNSDPQDLLRRADEALYSAKSSSRNRVALAADIVKEKAPARAR